MKSIFKKKILTAIGNMEYAQSGEGLPTVVVVPSRDVGGEFAISTGGSTSGVTLEITIPI